jgi:voltage-gated potassium channel
MLSASIMNLIEGEAQPEAFGSIPAAMWWAMATLTTVGYGDVVPITPLGKMFGGLVTIMGIAMYALPIAIVANGFANQQTRRDFVITWGMLSRVPIFAALDPVSISKVAGILRARRYPAHYEVAHRGEPAECMYFIVSGELMVDTGERRAVLSEGDFVGEMALLNDTTRMAHIITLTDCRLLLLMKHDFHGLLEGEPKLRTELEAAGLAHAEALRDQGVGGGA